jgi:hypothetical protein
MQAPGYAQQPPEHSRSFNRLNGTTQKNGLDAQGLYFLSTFHIGYSTIIIEIQSLL